jgi:hypothetical protein
VPFALLWLATPAGAGAIYGFRPRPEARDVASYLDAVRAARQLVLNEV